MNSPGKSQNAQIQQIILWMAVKIQKWIRNPSVSNVLILDEKQKWQQYCHHYPRNFKSWKQNSYFRFEIQTDENANPPRWTMDEVVRDSSAELCDCPVKNYE